MITDAGKFRFDWIVLGSICHMYSYTYAVHQQILTSFLKKKSKKTEELSNISKYNDFMERKNP